VLGVNSFQVVPAKKLSPIWRCPTARNPVGMVQTLEHLAVGFVGHRRPQFTIDMKRTHLPLENGQRCKWFSTRKMFHDNDLSLLANSR